MQPKNLLLKILRGKKKTKLIHAFFKGENQNKTKDRERIKYIILKKVIKLEAKRHHKILTKALKKSVGELSPKQN